MMLTAPNIGVGGSQPSQQLLLPRIPPPGILFSKFFLEINFSVVFALLFVLTF